MIPLTLITGFLGAGKTTFLSRLLDYRMNAAPGETYAPRTLAVVVNEFAELGLDGAQLPDGDYQKWELNRGSIFCVCMRTDFIALLQKIVTELAPDGIWVEATGIADVSDVFTMINVPGLHEKLYLRSNICLIDPRTILKILKTLRAAREQVRLADMLVINKIDTADEDTLVLIEQELRSRNPLAPIIRADHGRIDLSLIPGHETPRPDAPGGGGHQPQPVYSVSITEQWIIAADEFIAWCRAQEEKLWRVKGRLATPTGPVWIEGTMADISIAPCPPDMNLPAGTALVLIGPGLQKETVCRELGSLSVKMDDG